MKILVIRTDRLGEVLLTLPAVEALREAYPHARLTMLVNPTLATLLDGVPPLNGVLSYQEHAGIPWWGRAIRLSRRLAPEGFDMAIIANAKKEFHLATRLAGIPRRIGYDRKWGWLLTDRCPDHKAIAGHHEVEYNLKLVQQLPVPLAIPLWRLPVFEREQAVVRRQLEQHGLQPHEPLVAIHPWASNLRKQWPFERFHQLARMILERLTTQVAVVGEPTECQRGAGRWPDGLPLADLVGRLTLRELAMLLRRSAVVVSNDSGPVHLAAAVGTKTVVLFGSSDAVTGPRRWGPCGAGHTVLWKPSMNAISVEDVFEAVSEQLQTSARDLERTRHDDGG